MTNNIVSGRIGKIFCRVQCERLARVRRRLHARYHSALTGCDIAFLSNMRCSWPNRALEEYLTLLRIAI
jgi:hypothetical protein